jgi:hypothetical protein
MAADVSVSGGKVRTPIGDAPIVPLFLIGFGGYLTWFAVKYWRGTGPAIWPSYPVKSVLQGKGLPANTTAVTAEVKLAAFESQAGTGSAFQGTVPKGTAQNTAKLLLSRYGWQAAQFVPLLALWTRESGWSNTARNKTSGAFGIAQALGHGGQGTAAPDGTNEYGAQYGLTAAEARLANAGSARWQIEWGLGYIKSGYGSPAAAWRHEQTFGWY